MLTDPFAHHPGLQGKIKNPEESFFRNFTVENMIASFPQMEAQRDKVHSDEVREELRKEVLAGHVGDLWVFAYGSLMWDPGFVFKDVRRALVPGYALQMILKDTWGGRGTAEVPGLMAALDSAPDGPGCQGLVFCIAADQVDEETEILCRRELLGPAYMPRFVTAQIEGQEVRALTFVADHRVDDIQRDLTREEQITYIAYGQGFLGTSYEYLANILAQFEVMGIKDPACAALLADVDAYLAKG